MPWTLEGRRRTIDKGIENVFAVFWDEIVDVAKDPTKVSRRVRCALEDVVQESCSTNHMITEFLGQAFACGYVTAVEYRPLFVTADEAVGAG